MRELEFLKIINKTLSKNSHLGDDCAYLKDFGIVITQDSFVEDVHFSTKFATPYEIGYKSLMVNISDVLASGAKPKYITISLSLPKSIDNDFIKEFYRACEDVSQKYQIEIVGGDITGSDKIFISICALGETKGRNISSRGNAKDGDIIITTGFYGSSAAGLYLLQNEILNYPELVRTHKMPKLNIELSEFLSKTKNPYTMMDTSDGLMDALFKIAKASNKTLCVDFAKIPYDRKIEKLAEKFDRNYKDWILYGGEDYQLLACVSFDLINLLPKNSYHIIGKVKPYQDNFVQIIDGELQYTINNLDKTFNHFD